MRSKFAGLIVTAMSCCSAAHAAEAEGGFTAVAQTTSDDRIDPEATGSVDLIVSLNHGDNQLQIYVEGSTTVRDGHVSALVPEANADAGTALAHDGEGRFQVSELKYIWNISDSALTVGLLDQTAYADHTLISNDESSQFLTPFLVNNPGIEFPDYAVGLVYESSTEPNGRGFTAIMTSSHGLGDNRSSYADSVKLDGEEKGVFGLISLYARNESAVQEIGAWINSADHARFDGTGDESNFGVYGVLGKRFGAHAVDVRVGYANPNVSMMESFVSAAYQYATDTSAVGLGAGYGGLSNKADPERLGDTTVIEAYAARTLWETLVTASVQYIVNSGFDESDRVIDKHLTVYGIRLSRGF